METLLGVKGKDFVMIAADSTHANSIIVLKSGKIARINLTSMFGIFIKL